MTTIVPSSSALVLVLVLVRVLVLVLVRVLVLVLVPVRVLVLVPVRVLVVVRVLVPVPVLVHTHTRGCKGRSPRGQGPDSGATSYLWFTARRRF